MTLIAGLDFGTSSVKLTLATPDGQLAAYAQASYPTHSGPGGQAEQDAQDWWNGAAAVIAETGLGDRIDAMGVTGQMQDCILVANGQALRPVLLYSDTRAITQHNRLCTVLPNWENMTGNHQDVTNVPAKIAWIADHQPAILARAEHLLFGAPGYIAWRATGVAACDVLTASTTGLLDVRRQDWSTKVVQAAGARIHQMPTLVGTTAGDTLIGTVGRMAATHLGVRSGIPVVHAMGDAGAATDGLVGTEPGDAYLYLGTTGWIAAVSASPGAEASPIHSLVLPGWKNRLRIGAVQSAGSAADWSRRTFLQGLDFNSTEALVAPRVADPSALAVRPLALPGIAGERTPIRDASFRGAFVGVHEATQPLDFHLAILTGVALALRHAADELGIEQRRIPLVGGASVSPAWRRIIADVFNATVVTRDTNDPGTHCALRSVMTALDIPHHLPPLFDADDHNVETVPSLERATYEPLIEAHRALYDALAPTFHRFMEEY